MQLSLTPPAAYPLLAAQLFQRYLFEQEVQGRIAGMQGLQAVLGGAVGPSGVAKQGCGWTVETVDPAAAGAIQAQDVPRLLQME